MKTKLTIIALFFALKITAQVGISANGAAPDATAILDVSSTTKGILLPRMTTAARDLLDPVLGLTVFDTNTKSYWFFNGDDWKELLSGSPTASFPAATICCQRWMAKNLDVSTYRNGDPIPQVTDQAAWAGLTTGAWCYYQNNTANGPIYGKLYNWYAVNDTRGLAPEGWHIPTDFEWNSLSTCLGGDAVAGKALKEIGIVHWKVSGASTVGTDIASFTALPSGIRNEQTNIANPFSNTGEIGGFWATGGIGNIPFSRYLGFSDSALSTYNPNPKQGLSVRCVKD